MNKKGFTLIELLVVISIIGLLSSVVLASLNSARSKARDARRKQDLHNIQIAVEQYYSNHGSYFIANSGWDDGKGNFCGCGWYNYPYSRTSVSQALINDKVMGGDALDPLLPNDVTAYYNGQGQQYMYYQCGNGYYIYTHLENPSTADQASYASIPCPAGYNMNYAIGHI